MFWQKEVLREGIAMTLNDTYILELPDFGQLGSLLFRFSGSQASGMGQSGGKWRILDYINKLEVILNGSTICKSLKGDMIQAIAFLDQGIVSPDAWRNYATNTQWCYMLLNFGRKLNDKVMGLDLSKFNTVELKVGNDATSSEFSDIAITTIANWGREMDTPFQKYMRTEEWKKWTTVQDETKYETIPAQWPVRRIILQAVPNVDSDNVESTGMHNLMDDVELTLRSGVTRMYKGGIDDIMRMNYYHYGKPLITGGFPYMTADKGINVGLGYVFMEAHGPGAQDGAVAATIATMESARTSFTQKPETYEADSPICLITGGLAYHNTVIFPFDEEPEPESWLDTVKEASINLNIHTRNASSAASGTNKIILDRPVAIAA